MLNQGYSNSDLENLTTKARTLWEYDLISMPKKIRRRENAEKDKVPLRAIYRMVVEDWAKHDFNCYYFPFTTNSFYLVLGLAEGWDIPLEDRKYIEKDMVLFASDERTILILPELDRRWWESSWFSGVSLALGIIGVVIGFK